MLSQLSDQTSSNNFRTLTLNSEDDVQWLVTIVSIMLLYYDQNVHASLSHISFSNSLISSTFFALPLVSSNS